jgi:chromosome segregation ATPase
MYTFQECYKALDVDPKTFRGWLERDGMKMHQSEADARVKFLTEEEVKGLAARHGRPWPPAKREIETIPPASYKLLLEQTAQAARQAEQIRADHAQLQKLAQGITAHLDTISQEQTALCQQIEGLQEQWNHVTSFQSDVTELRGRFRTQREDIEKYQKQTGAALEKITTDQQKTAARLDILAATDQEQQQQLSTMQETSDLTRTMLGEIDTRQQQATAHVDTLITTAGRLQQEIATLQAQQMAARTDLDTITAATQEQAQRLEQLDTRIEALQSTIERNQQVAQEQLDQAQARMQEQFRQAEKGLKAEFQAALHVLRQEMQAQQEQQARDLYAAIHSAEQEEARDVQALTATNQEQARQLQQIQRQAEQAAASAEAASIADRGRLDVVEQRLVGLEVQRAGEQPPPTKTPRSKKGAEKAEPPSGTIPQA